MEQSILERVRAENAQMCQQLADAAAVLDKVASSVRDLPKLPLPVGDLKIAAPSNSGWVAVGSSLGKQKQRAKPGRNFTPAHR